MGRIAYKLFRTKNNKLYPLYVLADKETPIGEWLTAEDGIKSNDGKHVKSKLGYLCYRPGWHCSDIPYAPHIGKKGEDGKLLQKKDTVWCEVEYVDAVDYQTEANKNGTNKKGIVIPAKAYLKEIPVGGFYRYKTNPNMYGSWIIAGAIKVNRIISNEEVEDICMKNGIKPQELAS